MGNYIRTGASRSICGLIDEDAFVRVLLASSKRAHWCAGGEGNRVLALKPGCLRNLEALPVR